MQNKIFTEKEAVDKVISCSKIYQKNLSDRSFLILYKDRNTNKTESLELIFRPGNYQHLTGLNYLDESGNIKEFSSVEFYHKCLSALLTTKEISFKDNTTNLKLGYLDGLITFTKIARITGIYNQSKPVLEGDYLVGNNNGFYAISKNGENDTYYPRSVLNEDIRKYTITSNQVLGILSADYSERQNYNKIEYVAKGVNLKHLRLPEAVKNRVDLSNYIEPRNSKETIERDIDDEIDR